MHKKRILTTPLAAVLGLLAFLVIPSAASAHHIEVSATCKLVNNASVVDWQVKFVEFSSSGAKDDVEGTVKLDGATVGQVPPDDIDWNGNNGTLSGRDAAAADQTHTVVGDFRWLNDHNKKSVTTNKCPKPTPPPNPGIKIVKDGPSTRYVGDQATFTYDVTNTGNKTLTNVTVTDDKCSPLVKVTNDSSFDPGNVWKYTCTVTITDAMGDQLVNVAQACGKYGDTRVCDDDDHKTNIPKPAIALVKDGAATAAAGSTFTYTFKATNIGNVTLTNVVLTDDKCQSTLTRTEPNLADPTFDKGDEWFFTCTVVAPNGPAQVDNLANVCGDYQAPGVDKRTVCAEDPHTFTVPPPVTPPNNPPSNPPATPPTSTPDTGVLPESIVSGRAQLRGPSGCVKQAFRARVSGRSISAVTFFVDGRQVKKVKGKRASYSLTVRPGSFGFGRHKIEARVQFTAASGTKARRLPLTFRRCAQGTVAPRFTG